MEVAQESPLLGLYVQKRLVSLPITYYHAFMKWHGSTPFRPGEINELLYNLLLPTFLLNFNCLTLVGWTGHRAFWPAFHSICLHITDSGGTLLLFNFTLPYLSVRPLSWSPTWELPNSISLHPYLHKRGLEDDRSIRRGTKGVASFSCYPRPFFLLEASRGWMVSN
jgi:hypothetical protein